MPARTPPPRTPVRIPSGFGGFTPNPSIPYPGGRVLAGDVEQASNAMEFGGNPSPTATPTPVPVATDPSGAGYVNSGLFQGGTFGSHNTVWFGEKPRATGGVEADASLSQDAPRAPTVTSGDPRLPAGPGGMNGEPSLFGDQNAAGPTVDVSGRGGGLPSPYWNQPSAPRYAGSGSDIAGFGGNMTLGQFLSTPLAMLRFGSGRYQDAGAGRVNYANTGYDVAAAAPGATDVAPPSSEAEALGAQETAAARSRGELPPASGPAPARPANMINAVLAALPGLNNPAAIRALQAGANPSDLIGHAQFDSHAAGQLEMSSQAFGGNPNNMGATGDEGHTAFYFNRAGAPMGSYDFATGSSGSAANYLAGNRPLGTYGGG